MNEKRSRFFALTLSLTVTVTNTPESVRDCDNLSCNSTNITIVTIVTIVTRSQNTMKCFTT